MLGSYTKSKRFGHSPRRIYTFPRSQIVVLRLARDLNIPLKKAGFIVQPTHSTVPHRDALVPPANYTSLFNWAIVHFTYTYWLHRHGSSLLSGIHQSDPEPLRICLYNCRACCELLANPASSKSKYNERAEAIQSIVLSGCSGTIAASGFL